MLQRTDRRRGWQTFTLTAGLALATIVSGSVAVGQQVPVPVPTFPSINIVGGVAVSVDGVVSNLDTQQRNQLREARQRAMQAVPGDLNQPAKLRMVSLRKLEEQVRSCIEAGRPIPDEVKYLAGLQRVQYLFVYPEENDIVIAGPAEGWVVNQEGHVVGINTGRPVLHLDDLLVALRYADAARANGLTASIDPTPEGLQRLNALRRNVRTIGNNPQQTVAAFEDALGPQKITVGGLPEDSRFASVLVAADYRMKRLGMNLDASPIPALTSYLHLAGTAAGKNPNMMPRWWLAPHYDALGADDEGLAFELRGSGVKCMAEEDYFTTDGQRQKRMKANPASQKWADLMTKHYDELSAKITVFGDLRNCMDLAVIGALISRENLLEKANLPLHTLLDPNAVALDRYQSPKQVPTQASVMKKGGDWMIAVSGGIAAQPWEFVDKREKIASVAPVRAEVAKARSDRWWWN